jgi:hypothetical protein
MKKLSKEKDYNTFEYFEKNIFFNKEGVLINGNRIETGLNSYDLNDYSNAQIQIRSRQLRRRIGWLLLILSPFLLQMLIGFFTIPIGIILIFQKDIHYIFLNGAGGSKEILKTKRKKLAMQLVEAINKAYLEISNYRKTQIK